MAVRWSSAGQIEARAKSGVHSSDIRANALLSQNGTLSGAWAARLIDQAAPNEEALQETIKGVELDTGDLIDE